MPDEDPYDTPGERAEILTVRGKVLYEGPFSTYREIHIAIRGFYAGLRTGTFEDLPKVPAEWADEGQYYEGMAAIAYDVKRGQQSALVAVVTVILAYLRLKGVL